MKEIFKKHRFLFVVNVLLLVLVSLVEAAAIFTIIPVVDLFLNSNPQNYSLITRKIVEAMHYMNLPVTMGAMLFVFLAFNIIGSGLKIIVEYFSLKIKYAVLRQLSLGTFDDFFNAKWYFFTSNKQGIFLNTFIKEITVVGDAFGAMIAFFATLIQLLLYLIVPFYLSWKVSSISLGVALLFVCPFAILGKISYRLGRLNTATANQFSSLIQESLSSAKVILGYANQDKCSKMLRNAFDAHTQVTLKSQTITAAAPLMYYPLGLLVVIISLFTANKLLVSLSVSAALFYSFLKIVPTFGQLPKFKSSMDNFFPSYEQVLSLRNLAVKLKQKSGEIIFKGFKKEILIKNLSFAYPDHPPILIDLNARIPKGGMVAFVGKSGGGKSTLIDLIMGFHEPSCGEISIDGILLREFDIASYRKRIGYVPQDSILFDMSIRDNLLWAKDYATEEEIRQACFLANAEEFIAELPKGYETLVGDRGVRLSGGQVQRIALARAVLRKPEILILDEATSSLDTHSERLIQEAINNISKETTIIIIAHRLSTVVNADYIYILNKGRVIEEGSYPELIRKNGEFSRMLRFQSLETKEE